MAQNYRIYINEKVILLTGKAPAQIKDYQKIDSEYFDLKIIFPWVDNQPGKLFYVLSDDPKAFLKQITKTAKLVEAAGGLVKNEAGNYLFIYRNDKWDLPKGKIEEGEKTKVAAVREVEEECGIKVAQLGDKICKTYHMYHWKGKTVLKKTHWFAMTHKGKTKLVPQVEEGITDARWLGKEQIDLIMQNTFPSIVDVLEIAELIEKREDLAAG
ncbi:NUDIX hydrolase [Mucilaginibacter glaciei]|uniref:NUDIX domain-containing protein n=1 Tax=Mucilaginibacter glaciei TaxID=2772109 RepID=A0A926NNA7_9SPHI|nr:NUDIX domain-containing protein [Mucilaginibacter glaciei]MBD1392358.1 NUDIX domain-containing protein [Mucilaginibacter glaciei]